MAWSSARRYITEPLHGVDPMKEQVTQNQCLLTIMVVLYKAKIALTGFRAGPTHGGA
jgi:hypothetical protein